VRKLPQPVFFLRVAQLAIGALTGIGLFVGGFVLVIKAASESAGLAMILAGVIVFVVPFVFQAKISRDRMTIEIMYGFSKLWRRVVSGLCTTAT
jgi:hypothetical protein